MESSKLKKKILIRALIYIAAIAVLVAVCIYLDNLKTEFANKRDRLRNDTFSLNRKLDGLSKKVLELSDAIQVWEEAGGNNQQLNGLRINDAKDLLDEWEKKYKLSEVKTSFEKPERLQEKKLQTDIISVIGSNVNITFKAITDEHVYNFINELLEEYPGYIWIRSFDIKKSGEVTKEILQKIALGDKPNLIEVRLDLVWRDLKYNGPIPSNGDN